MRYPLRQEILLSLEASLSALLAGHGFAAEPMRFQTTKHRFVGWPRNHGWKRDEIRVSHRPGGESIGLGIEVHLPVGDGGEHKIFDGLTVPTLLDRRAYWLPTGSGAFARLRARRLVRRIARDCRDALTWFELTATPAAALARLKTGETNGCGAEGLMYARAEAHLEALAEAGARRPEA